MRIFYKLFRVKKKTKKKQYKCTFNLESMNYQPILRIISFIVKMIYFMNLNCEEKPPLL